MERESYELTASSLVAQPCSMTAVENHPKICFWHTLTTPVKLAKCATEAEEERINS